MAAARRCCVRLMTPKINTPICSLTRAIVSSAAPHARGGEGREEGGDIHFIFFFIFFLYSGPSIFRILRSSPLPPSSEFDTLMKLAARKRMQITISSRTLRRPQTRGGRGG